MVDLISHPIVAMVTLIGLLIFVHELGHFLVGKAFGIGVEIFSIGFGPTLLGFTYKNTEYRLAWIPLGGFVKFAGSLPSEPVADVFKGKEMHRASLSARALTLFAGPFANFLLAVLLFMVLGMEGIEHPAPVIGEVRSESPAERAGLLPGDRVLSINNAPVRSWTDIQKAILEAPGQMIPIQLYRYDFDLRQGAENEADALGILANEELRRPSNAVANSKAIGIERQQKIHDLTMTLDSVELEDFAGRLGKRGRAGIGYGFLPAVVTVLDPTSIAAQAGLRTADAIHQVEFAGKLIPIKSWYEFLQILEQAYQQRTAEIRLQVAPAQKLLVEKQAEKASEKLSEKQAPQTAPKKELTLPLLAAWQALEPETSKLSQPALRRALASTLGLKDSQLTVSHLEAPASQTLQVNDSIVSVAGQKLQDIYQLQDVLGQNHQEQLPMQVLRQNKPLDILLNLKAIDLQKPSGRETAYALTAGFWTADVYPESYLEIYENPLSALRFGVQETKNQTFALASVIKGLFIGEVPLKSLGGPMLIAKVAGDSARQGWKTFVNSMALISLNLGLMNLFPIPALDGGQLVLIGWQMLRRRPLSELAIENFQRLGFVMIMSLIVLATYNDLSRFWASMMIDLVGFFK